jgi:hypothetical protein
MTKNVKKIYSGKNFLFQIKNCNLLIPRPPQRTSKLQEKPSPSKKIIEHFKTWNFLTFLLLLWIIFALVDPDPVSESGSGSTDLIESVSDSYPDPTHWWQVVITMDGDSMPTYGTPLQKLSGGKLQFLIKKIPVKFFSSCKYFIFFWSSKPWIWIRIGIQP